MNSFSHPELIKIARVQKQVIKLILISIVLLVISLFPWPEGVAALLVLPVSLGFIFIALCSAVLLYRLGTALDDPAPWLYAVLSLMPGINTAVLLILNLRATAALKKHGIQVGVMGALDFPTPTHTAGPPPIARTEAR